MPLGMPTLVLLSLLAMGLTYALMKAARVWLGLHPLLVARVLTVGMALAGTALRSWGQDNLSGYGIFLQLFSLGSGGLWETE